MTKLKVEADGAWVDAEDLYVEEGGQWNLLGPAAQAPTPSFIQLATITPAVVSGNLIFWHPTSSQFPFAYTLTNGNNRVDNDGMAPARIHNRSFTPRIDRFVNDETVPSNMVFTGWVGIFRRLFWDVTQEGASGSAGGASGAADGPSGQQTSIPTITGRIHFVDRPVNSWRATFTASQPLQENDIIEVEHKQYLGADPTPSNPGGGWTPWNLGQRRVGSAGVRTWHVNLPEQGILSRGGITGLAVGEAARTRVTRPAVQVSIDSITVSPYSGNRLRREATVTVNTTNAQQVRIRIISNDLVSLSLPSWGRDEWSPWTAPTNGTTTFADIPLFYASRPNAASTSLLVYAQARRGTTVVEETLLVSNLPEFNPPTISWGTNPIQLRDPDALSPVTIIAIAGVAALLSGGVAFFAAVGGTSAVGAPILSAPILVNAAGGSVALSGGTVVASLAATGGGGTVVLSILTSAGTASFFTASTVGLVGAFGAGGVVAGLSAVLTGGAQRDLTATAIVRGGVTRSRARLGWRIEGFADAYTAWSSWRAGPGQRSWTWPSVGGGRGALLIEVQAEGPDGAINSSLGVGIETDALIAPGSTNVYNQATDTSTLTINGYGMTGLRYRVGFGANPGFAPDFTGNWTVTNAQSRAGRVGTVRFTVPGIQNWVQYQMFSGQHRGATRTVSLRPSAGQAEPDQPPEIPAPPPPLEPPPPLPPPLPAPSEGSGPAGQQASMVSPWVYVSRRYPVDLPTPRPTTPPEEPTGPTTGPGTDPTGPTGPTRPTGPGTGPLIPPGTVPPPTGGGGTPAPVRRATDLGMRFELRSGRTVLRCLPSAVGETGFRIRGRWGTAGTYGTPIPADGPGAGTEAYRFSRGPFDFPVPPGAAQFRAALWAASTDAAITGPAYFDFTMPDPLPANLRASFSFANGRVTVTPSGDNYAFGRGRARFRPNAQVAWGAWSSPSPSDSGGARRWRTGTFEYGVPGGATLMQWELYAVNSTRVSSGEVGPAVFNYTIPTTPTAPPIDETPETTPEPTDTDPLEPTETTPPPEPPTAPVDPEGPGGGGIGPTPPPPAPPDPGIPEPPREPLVANQPNLSVRIAGQTFELGPINPDLWETDWVNIGTSRLPSSIRFVCGGRESGAAFTDYRDVVRLPQPSGRPWPGSVFLAFVYQQREG